MTQPPPGTMVYWRFKTDKQWRFGYCTYASGHSLLRMGRWNGDAVGGTVVSVADIEWRPYQ